MTERLTHETIGETLVLDTRGLSCPEPVLATKAMLSRMHSGKIIVLLDSPAARDNVMRVARNAGWQVTCTSDTHEFRLEISREAR